MTLQHVYFNTLVSRADTLHVYLQLRKLSTAALNYFTEVVCDVSTSFTTSTVIVTLLTTCLCSTHTTQTHTHWVPAASEVLQCSQTGGVRLPGLSVCFVMVTRSHRKFPQTTKGPVCNTVYVHHNNNAYDYDFSAECDWRLVIWDQHWAEPVSGVTGRWDELGSDTIRSDRTQREHLILNLRFLWSGTDSNWSFYSTFILLQICAWNSSWFFKSKVKTWTSLSRFIFYLFWIQIWKIHSCSLFKDETF